MVKSLADYNSKVHYTERLGSWRELYLRILKELDYQSILEIGAGSPEFLETVDCSRRMAIDGSDKYKKQFTQSGISFYHMDLDNDPFPAGETYDVVVCSDVFEHLIYAERTLKYISSVLTSEGVLISHVPNEFIIKKTFMIMLGFSEAIYSHPHCEEHNYPHLHRFTKIGYEKFLNTAFKYNLYISDLRYSRLTRFFYQLGFRIPYTLERGPTFLSTNSIEKFEKLRWIKKSIKGTL